MSAPTHRPLHTANPATRDRFFYGWRYVERTRDDGSTYVEQVPLTEWDVLHPQEGDDIVPSDPHDEACNYLKNVFRWRTAGKPGIRVFSDHRIDFQVPEIEPLGPDVIVLADAPPCPPDTATYRVRDLGAKPLLVVEITSPATRRVDLNDKVALYALIGIPLLAIIDAARPGMLAQPSLEGLRHTPKGYESVPLEMNRLWLPEPINLWLTVEGDQVVCLDAEGHQIGDYTTVAHMAAEAEARAAAAERRAEEERQRADLERQRAEAERQRAEVERRRAEESERRAQELEAEIRRLRGEG